MLKPLTTAVVAATVWVAMLNAPATAKDANAVTAAAVQSTAVSARAQATTPVVKRVRKAQPRRVAAVAAPGPYYSQCFLFFCSSGSRPYPFLVLGVAY